MAHVSNVRHLRRIATPKEWPIERKGGYWIVRPKTVGIPFELCMPILLWLRDYLKIVKNRREARYILSKGKITINGKIVKEIDYPAGIFDTVGILDLEKYYRVVISKNRKLGLVEIPKSEDGLKIIKIVRKKMIKNGKLQYTGFDGRNFLIDDNNIKTGDSIFVDLKDNKIKDIIKMDPGCLLYFYKGNKAGKIGILKERKIFKKPFGITRFLIYEDIETKEIKETIEEYGIVIGREKELITIK